MQGAAAPKPESPSITNGETTAKPRDASQEQPERSDQHERDVSAADAASDDENELPVAPRRLKRRLERQSTPDVDEDATSSKPASPGLFVSSPARPSPAKSVTRDSESEDELPATKSDRFKALVERKRQERLAREAAEEARQAERRVRQEKLSSEMEQLDSNDDDVEDITDDEGGRTLTQKARPTRKASRKAIEEMNRETQRMQRSMQLAHEAKTRNRVTTASLFERFNYRPAGGVSTEPKTASSSRPGTPTPHSGSEAKDGDTPPTSPPVEEKQDTSKETVITDVTMGGAEDEELPSVDQIMSSSPPAHVDKGKGKAVALDISENGETEASSKRRVRVRLPITSINTVSLDSDDELEVVQSKRNKMDAVFNSIPTRKARESHSLHVLKALAHVRSPGKERLSRNDRTGMTTGELYNQLQLRARQQAKLERENRLNMLKAQGVVVETAEERERQMQEVEDIVAKAREEAHKIMQQEREESKGENNDKAHDPLAWDDSDDEEYQDSANEADGEASAVELSGSENEDEEDEGEKGEELELAPKNSLFDDEASDAESESSDSKSVNEEDSDADDNQAIPVQKQHRARKHTVVVSDDEEEEIQIEATPRPKNATQKTTPGARTTDSPVAPGSVLRSAKKTFIPGLPVEGPAGLGLTQIFAGTMDDSQMSACSGPTQSMMPDFDNFPDSNFSATMEDPGDEMVVDSQKEETQKATQAIQLDLAQSQMRGLDSLMRHESNSQLSEMIQFTQDGGFQDHTPLKDRFVEPPVSTVDTVVAPPRDEEAHESPLVRRGRLRRKVDVVLPEEEHMPARTAKSQTAFGIMKESAQVEKKKQAVDDFNRKKSKAKEMIEEQAEESEDEYAGLGGADGEDSDNESVASMKEMIDDAAGNDVDDRKLAAFYA
jgi:mediator of replication checkpoint protein 1